MTTAFRNPQPLFTGLAGNPPASTGKQAYRLPLPFILGLAGTVSVTGAQGFRQPFPFVLGLSGVSSIAPETETNTGAAPARRKYASEDEELLAVLAAALPVLNHRRGGVRRFSRSSSK